MLIEFYLSLFFNHDNNLYLSTVREKLCQLLIDNSGCINEELLQRLRDQGYNYPVKQHG